MKCEKCGGPMESVASLQVCGELVGDGTDTKLKEGRRSVECNLVCRDCGYSVEDDAIELVESK